MTKRAFDGPFRKTAVLDDSMSVAESYQTWRDLVGKDGYGSILDEKCQFRLYVLL